MSQTEFLAQVLVGVSNLPEERRDRIFLCKAKLEVLMHEYGEDGMMALALAGLEGAAKAEQEEVMERTGQELMKSLERKV